MKLEIGGCPSKKICVMPGAFAHGWDSECSSNFFIAQVLSTWKLYIPQGGMFMEHVKIRAHGQKREKIDYLVDEVIKARDLEFEDVYLWDKEKSSSKHAHA